MGKGSTFSFTARFELASEQADQLRRSRSGSLCTACRVLVVDDNATNRFILEEMTKHWGCFAEGVAGAKEALEALQEAAGEAMPYRILISDVNMPEVDGCTLLQWVRDDPDLAGHCRHHVDLRGPARRHPAMREAGDRRPVMKPVIQSELLDAIGMAVGQSQGPAQAGRGRRQRMTSHRSLDCASCWPKTAW